MNVIKFNSYKELSIVFCIIDNTKNISDGYVKELTKNQADFTISNLWTKGYTIYQGLNIDEVLKEASVNFDYACVLSTGTEILNGDNFFVSLEEELKDNFLIKGHILDRGDAYYELHHQCFLVNLKNYKSLGYPEVGLQSIGRSHTQFEPVRSTDNDHDNYTPLFITAGEKIKTYNHKCYGWNIISISLKNNLDIKRFSKSTLKNKKHFYPENLKDFYEHSRFFYDRENYCMNEFVHYSNTESNFKIGNTLTQYVMPASGNKYLNHIDKTKPVRVVIYDYNQKSLDYYEKTVPRLDNVTYSFVKWNLLTEIIDLKQYLDHNDIYTLIDLSNIFCYEGTAIFSSVKYRLTQENKLLSYIKDSFPNAYINFSGRSSTGFVNETSYTTRIDNIKLYNIQDFKKPTWRFGSDWLNFN
jgi:hypothetical protein